MPNKLRTAIIIVVLSVWSVNFTAPVFVRDYKPPAEINLAFMGIIGILTASYKKEDSK